MPTITLHAEASYGLGGKQFIARITGRDSKFTFAREFLGRRAGKRGEATDASVDDQGIYQERDADRKGNLTDTYYLVWTSPMGDLVKSPIDLDDAMALARRVEAGDPIEVIATEQISNALRASLESSREKDQDEPVELRHGCEFGTLPRGSYPRRELVAAREKLLAALIAPAAAPLAASGDPLAEIMDGLAQGVSILGDGIDVMPASRAHKAMVAIVEMYRAGKIGTR